MAAVDVDAYLLPEAGELYGGRVVVRKGHAYRTRFGSGCLELPFQLPSGKSLEKKLWAQLIDLSPCLRC